MLGRDGDGCRAMQRLIAENHEPPVRKIALRKRAWQLFRAQRVSVLDASAFGETANGFVRLGFVVEEARLIEACERIAAFVDGLRVR